MLSNVRNPKRLMENSDDVFSCIVDLTIEGVTETVVYVANKNDVAENGRWVHEQIINGVAGEIEEYTQPEPPSDEMYEGMARGQRDHLLTLLDAVVSNPIRWGEFTEEQKASVSAYRQDLLDITDQEGFPANIVWPQSPIG
jgi:hypothetical protein